MRREMKTRLTGVIRAGVPCLKGQCEEVEKLLTIPTHPVMPTHDTPLYGVERGRIIEDDLG
jgi:hypothetical protein